MQRLFALALLGAGYCGVAYAGPAYTADEIIEKFAPAAKMLGASRGICIGTEADCAGAPSRVESPVQDLRVTFDLDSATLTDSAKENLDQFALALESPTLEDLAFSIDGHTDARGAEAYNVDLSVRRAQAVADYLQSKGIDVAKFDVRGFGKSHPLTQDPFDAANRRVEAHLIQVK
jgi:outer membrane protein OmpA-like peptidoglycan-associated protein